jgi:hypothetical protein
MEYEWDIIVVHIHIIYIEVVILYIAYHVNIEHGIYIYNYITIYIHYLYGSCAIANCYQRVHPYGGVHKWGGCIHGEDGLYWKIRKES